MRIVLVCPYAWDSPGGVQAHVRGLAREMTRRGHAVRVIAPGLAPSSDPAVTIVGRPVRVRYNGSVAPICLHPLALARAARLVRDLRPDVVHVHEPFSPGLSLAATLAARAPVVATFHAGADRLWAYRLFAPLLRIVQRRCHHSIAVSEVAAALLERDLGLRADVRHNAVDLETFAGATPLALPPAPTALFVGRLEPRKGVRVLLQALPALIDRVPDVRVLIVGAGDERAEIDRLPASSRSHVHVIGALRDADLVRCYASAHVFVAPAMGRESFGIVLLEAMAAGLPVVASDIPGYRAVVRNGLDGLLVPAGDVARLATALAVVLTDRAMATALALNARQRAAAFSWRQAANPLEAIYEDVQARATRLQPRCAPERTPSQA